MSTVSQMGGFCPVVDFSLSLTRARWERNPLTKEKEETCVLTAPSIQGDP